MANTVVIGGTKGIGSVITSQLRKRGDKVYTVSRSTIKNKYHIKRDISTDCSGIFKNIAEIDYLIFAHRYRGNDWDESFEVTLKGIKNILRDAIDKLNTNSSVVILSSNASQFILEEQPAEYHASRAALDSLVRYYAVRFGKHKIRFNSLLPSTVLKPENNDFFNETNEVRNMIENITPLGRMGEAQDVANVVEFLCSSKSSFVTGSSIMIDGGLSLVGQETIARKISGLSHNK